MFLQLKKKVAVSSDKQNFGNYFHKYLQLFDIEKLKSDGFDGDSAAFKLVVFYGSFYIYSAKVSEAGEIKNLGLDMSINISKSNFYNH